MTAPTATIADQLLAEARRRGVTVTVEEDRVRLDGPPEVLDDRLVTLLQRHAPALIARLRPGHDGRWLRPLSPAGEGPGTVIVLFPAAGTGPGAYRAWTGAAPAGVEVVAVHAPGREERVAEVPPSDVAPLADAVAGQIRAHVAHRAGLRLVLVGHSTGALVAHEVALRLGATVHALVVAAAEPPDRAVDVGGLDDAALLAAAAAWSADEDAERPADGAGADLVDEAVSAALPVLRADLRVHASCRRTVGDPPALRVPVVVLCGAADRTVDAPACRGWAAFTSGPVTVAEVAGAHFFPVRDPHAVLGALTAQLTA